jgi:hypothetical protein
MDGLKCTPTRGRVAGRTSRICLRSLRQRREGPYDRLLVPLVKTEIQPLGHVVTMKADEGFTGLRKITP